MGSLGDIMERIINLKRQKKGKQENGMEIEAKKARDIIGEELLGKIEEALNDKLSQEEVAAAADESVEIEIPETEEVKDEITEQVKQVETFFELKRVLEKNWESFKGRMKKQHFNQMLISKSAEEFIESGIVDYFPDYVKERADDLANPEEAEGPTIVENLIGSNGTGEMSEYEKNEIRELNAEFMKKCAERRDLLERFFDPKDIEATQADINNINSEVKELHKELIDLGLDGLSDKEIEYINIMGEKIDRRILDEKVVETGEIDQEKVTANISGPRAEKMVELI